MTEVLLFYRQLNMTMMRRYLNITFAISFSFTIAGALMKIMHMEHANSILTIGMIALIAFIIPAIYEIRTSAKISVEEKTMWTIAFIFFSVFTGLVYLLMGRRRIA
ncbi:PLDc N-terminal domain-containing protein [Phnomibacter sp. MR]|uniref:PLDc N-terminal domain-containing protein n=1 Tax=Phnomibacter sp. MR TaxID=3042318 RepID=UPI003A808FE6